jgi:Flp pilus assembly protein TadG
VATPFLMMMFCIVNTGMYYYSVNCLDRGIEDAARKVRTGEAQNAGLTVGQFKTMVCASATTFIDCNNLSIKLQFKSDWAAITPESCLTNGNLAAGTGVATDLITGYVGTQDQVVMVTACYRWTTAKNLPFLKLGNLGDGSMLIQSATAFRTEPYT